MATATATRKAPAPRPRARRTGVTATAGNGEVRAMAPLARPDYDMAGFRLVVSAAALGGDLNYHLSMSVRRSVEFGDGETMDLGVQLLSLIPLRLFELEELSNALAVAVAAARDIEGK
jgi:hypothetical protein